MNLNVDDFRLVAHEIGVKIAWTDEELLQAIEVHQCLEAYFRKRGEAMICFAIRSELNTLESYAFARKWECSDDGKRTWQIRKKDGTFA